MTYQCINCECIWITDSQNDSEISHGLCKMCARKQLTPLLRKKQLLNGFFDCFARSKDYCDQWHCEYRYLCLVNEEEY